MFCQHFCNLLTWRIIATYLSCLYIICYVRYGFLPFSELSLVRLALTSLTNHHPSVL